MTPAKPILGHLIELIGNVAGAYTVALFTMEPGGETLISKLKHLLEHNPLNINGASMEAQTQWGLSVYPRDGKELFSLINQSRIRLAQKTKVMA